MAKRMSRVKLDRGVQVTVYIGEDLVRALDEHRRGRPELPGRSAVIREMLTEKLGERVEA